ncbi:MAG: hypothetical protein PHW83_06260 [Bacteroidales bacterium]|nr:hypothetical protein [Bacteroidales bacterium]
MILTGIYKEHPFHKRAKNNAKSNPEINGGNSRYDKTLGEFVDLAAEPFLLLKAGFYTSGIISRLTSNAVKVLVVITGMTDNEYRTTEVKNNEIFKNAGVSESTGKLAIRELKYYHLIETHYIPGGSRKHRKRNIVLSRWDTALKKLKKENKVIILGNNEIIAGPNKPLEEEILKRKERKAKKVEG